MCIIVNHDDQHMVNCPIFACTNPNAMDYIFFLIFFILPIYLQLPMQFKGSYKFQYLGSKLNNGILVMMDIF